MDFEQKREALKRVLQGDSGGDNSVIDALARMAQEASFPKKTLILGMDEPQRYLYLIVRGLARSYYIDEGGNDFTKLFVREGEFLIGEALFMDRSLEAFEAIEDTACLRFDAKDLRKVLLSTPETMAGYISALEGTIVYKMRREHDLQCLDATSRYLAFLETYPGIEGRLPQNLIASYLGMTKETLSRVRRKISDR